MAQNAECMERLYVYNGALAIVGISLGFNAVPSLLAGERSVSLLLIAVGSCGMIVAAVYQSLTTDPAEFTISTGALLTLIGAACLSLAGTALEFLTTP